MESNHTSDYENSDPLPPEELHSPSEVASITKQQGASSISVRDVEGNNSEEDQAAIGSQGGSESDYEEKEEEMCAFCGETPCHWIYLGEEVVSKTLQ